MNVIDITNHVTIERLSSTRVFTFNEKGNVITVYHHNYKIAVYDKKTCDLIVNSEYLNKNHRAKDFMYKLFNYARNFTTKVYYYEV